MADHPAALGVGEVAIGPPEEGLDPAQELPQPEGLGHVVVRAELQADDLVDLVVAGREHEHRGLGAGSAEAAEDLEAIDARQADIEDDEIGRLAHGDLEAFLARTGQGDGVALLLEGVLDAARNGVLVFDDEDRAGHPFDRTPAPEKGLRTGLVVPWALHFPEAPSSMSTAPTARPTLAAAPRDVTGKAVMHLRKAGQLPGVVFGHGLESTNVTVDAHELELLRRKTGPNSLVDLSVDGAKAQPVLVHGVQLHRVTQRPLHVDFFLVRMTEELIVDVPLVATGESEAVNTLGGTLLHPIEHVRVKALPDHLPQSIQYDITTLATFDDVIRLKELEIPGDVTLLTDLEEIVAKVLPPRVEEVEVPVVAEGEAVEGEEGAEGAEGAAEGGAAGATGGSDEASSEG